MFLRQCYETCTDFVVDELPTYCGIAVIFCASLSWRSSPKDGCSYVPEIRTGSTSPLRLFLKNGSIIFSKIAFAPLVVFDIFVSTRNWPCRSILWLIRL